MAKELDPIVLTLDEKEHGLERGDVGAVLHCCTDGNAFKAQFVTGEGSTAAVLTLPVRRFTRWAEVSSPHPRVYVCLIEQTHQLELGWAPTDIF